MNMFVSCQKYVRQLLQLFFAVCIWRREHMSNNCNGWHGRSYQGSGLHRYRVTNSHPRWTRDPGSYHQRDWWTHRWARPRQCQKVATCCNSLPVVDFFWFLVSRCCVERKHSTAFWLDISCSISKLLCFGTLISQKRADRMSPYYV